MIDNNLIRIQNLLEIGGEVVELIAIETEIFLHARHVRITLVRLAVVISSLES